MNLETVAWNISEFSIQPFREYNPFWYLILLEFYFYLAVHSQQLLRHCNGFKEALDIL